MYVSVCLSLKLSNRDESGAWLAIVTRIFFFFFFSSFLLLFPSLCNLREWEETLAHTFSIYPSLFLPLLRAHKICFFFFFFFFFFFSFSVRLRYDSDLTPLTLWQNWWPWKKRKKNKTKKKQKNASKWWWHRKQSSIDLQPAPFDRLATPIHHHHLVFLIICRLIFSCVVVIRVLWGCILLSLFDNSFGELLWKKTNDNVQNVFQSRQLTGSRDLCLCVRVLTIKWK